MTINLNNYEEWFPKRLKKVLHEADLPGVAQPQVAPPPPVGNNPAPSQSNHPTDPSVTNPAGQGDPFPQPGQTPDFAGDPNAPDMPEGDDSQDFETWKKEFFELSIAGDTNQMLDSVNLIRA